MKAKLETAYRWQGKTYLPGEEVEIPEDLAKAIGIEKKEEEKQKEEEEKEETPSPATKSRTKA
ncbi:hypothetical protein [Chroococcidiopsis sp.]|uniref:hypothetical protein n=1 Tax=Chroococcidiopsis sp. TaxID=3088168 RepID=UPI003F320257